MKIPRKLKIGGRTIRIKYVPMKGQVGEADYAKGLILLKRGLPQDAKEAVLIHEIFHHINTTMSHNLLDSLSEQVYQVLKDNNLLR